MIKLGVGSAMIVRDEDGLIKNLAADSHLIRMSPKTMRKKDGSS